jgi:hypothetical protein
MTVKIHYYSVISVVSVISVLYPDPLVTARHFPRCMSPELFLVRNRSFVRKLCTFLLSFVSDWKSTLVQGCRIRQRKGCKVWQLWLARKLSSRLPRSPQCISTTIQAPLEKNKELLAQKKY